MMALTAAATSKLRAEVTATLGMTCGIHITMLSQHHVSHWYISTISETSILLLAGFTVMGQNAGDMNGVLTCTHSSGRSLEMRSWSLLEHPTCQGSAW